MHTNQRTTQPVEIDTHQLDQMREFRDKVQEHYAGLAGPITWINAPFSTDFWSNRRKKPKPNKCICEHCGNKHALKA